MRNLSQVDGIEHLRLANIFTPEQEIQLAKILVDLMANGWGTLEIEIRKGKIRFFKPKYSFDAVPPEILVD